MYVEPGSVELHLHSTVQGCAAELKLQHEVNLRRNRKKEKTPAWSDTFHLKELKFERAQVQRAMGDVGPTFDWERNTG